MQAAKRANVSIKMLESVFFRRMDLFLCHFSKRIVC